MAMSRLRFVLRIAIVATCCLSLPTLAEEECSLKCQQGAPCVEGEANFSAHPNVEGKDTTDFTLTTSINGQHCACPHKYTGVLCDISFESCDSQHPCYNRGQCVPGLLDEYGNEQLYCNCANAVVDGIPHVGKYCEHAADEFCDDAKTIFCVNNGRCNPDYPSGGPCLCPTGYEGPSCQYKEGSVPDCTLECQNGGVCSFDFTSDEPAYEYWEENVNASSPSNMRCKCPDGYTGRFCEVQQEPCGDGFCLHGGTCITHVVDGVQQFDCDCTTTYTDTESYAGTMCQFPATSYCTKSSGGLNGNLFCTNHGRCKEDPVQGCDCDDPFTGFSCEFILEELVTNSSSVDTIQGNESDVIWLDDVLPPIAPLYGDIVYDTKEDAECTLQCKNGGACRVGVQETGFTEDVPRNNPTFLNQTTHENFQHCVCPDGFYGLLCEESASICGNNEHMCKNGGKCIRNDQDDHACDCSDSGNNMDIVYAGDSCEHQVDDICTEESDAIRAAAPLSFCVNGGTCKKRVTAQEGHPGCYCPDGFTGPHCEINEATWSSYGSGETNSGSSAPPAFQVVAVIISVIAILTVGMFAGSAYARRQRKRKDIANTLRWTDSLYRDDRDEVNIAPRRASYLDEPYPVNQHSSSTDPMATFLAPKPPAAPATSDGDDDDEPEPQPTVYIGPPRDEDGHVLHNVEIC